MLYGLIQQITPPLGSYIEEKEVNYESLYLPANIDGNLRLVTGAKSDIASCLQISTTNVDVDGAFTANSIAVDSGGQLTSGGAFVSTPDAITATGETVAASLTTMVTEITTNSDGDLDNVSLANGTVGQIKVFQVKIAGGGDTVKITPASFFGWTTITFDADGDGCIMVYTSDGWNVVGNNGGVLA